MSSLSSLVGTVIAGRYRIERPIGEGGMGAVFEATQLSLSRRVAVKVLKPAFEQDDERIKRFELETQVISRLQHPHIVNVVDAGRSEAGLLFLAMELLEGQTLRQLLKQEGTLHWPRAVTIAEGVASALVAAHAEGIIHRDLKAENVLLWERAGVPDFAKVLDFGVAKLTSQVHSPVVTGTGVVAGTPGFIAPEQILGKSEDPRGDLYSLGVLMFEMISGRPPFLAKNPMELMLQHLQEPPPRLSEVMRMLGRTVPAPVDALVNGLLQKDPELRPPNALALVDALRALRDSMASTAVDTNPPTPSGSTPPPLGVVIGSKLLATPPLAPPLAALTAPTAPAAATTSPTTARPLALTPRLWTRPRVAAAVVALLVAGGIGGTFGMMKWRSYAVAIDGPARAHMKKALDAFWDLDLRTVTDETDLALQRDPDIPLARMLRAQVIVIEDGPLSRVDAEITAALAAAEHRNQGVRLRGRSEAGDFVEVLAELDVDTARARYAEHDEQFGCYKPLERLMFANKLLSSTHDPALLKELYQQVDPEQPMSAAVAVGLSRVLVLAGDRAGAREVLLRQMEKNKSAALLHRLVDVEMADGHIDKARALLDEQRLRDRGDARAHLRAGALGLRQGDDSALLAFLASVRALPAGSPPRIDGVFFAGLQYASAGRLKDGERLWDEAFAGARITAPDRAAEIASIVVFFCMLNDDWARAEKWFALSKEWATRITNPRTEARTKVFNLAGNLLFADPREQKGADLIDVDLGSLKAAKRDISLVLQQVQFSQALWSHQFDVAEQLSQQLPRCFKETYHAMVLRERGAAAGQPAERQQHLRDAAAEWSTLIEPGGVAACTTTAGFLSLFQEMVLRIAVGELGRVGVLLEDKELVTRAQHAHRTLWPKADDDQFNSRLLAWAVAWRDTGTAGPMPSERRPGPAAAIDPSATGTPGLPR